MAKNNNLHKAKTAKNNATIKEVKQTKLLKENNLNPTIANFATNHLQSVYSYNII